MDYAEEIIKLLKKKIKEEITLEIPPDNSLGDYAFPCFPLSKVYKKNPAEIAKELTSKLEKHKPELIERMQAAGPYINFFLDKKIFAEDVLKKIDKDYGKSKEGKGHKIVIDFSGPNIGKPMHIGHIRSTIIGDSLVRMHDFLGYDVIGINYLGDIGLHIGKLIVAYELWLDKKALKENPVQELLRLYVKFCDEEKTEYNEDAEEEFQDNEWTNKAKEKLRLIELGDEKTHKIWNDIIESSKKGFDQIYKLLNVNFHETTGQSLFSEKGKQIITEALKNRLAKMEDDGAVYVELDKLGKKYVLRSNKTASYITQDIGAAADRYKKYKFDKMIYITDFRQEIHFKQLFAILAKFGYDFADKLEHLPFGTVNFGNEIMATRKGKVILLDDVLKKTIEKALEEVKKRGTKGDPEKIGVGAIKYAVLKNEPRKDVNFSWETALNFEGNTGPYLQYSYARASSILKKAGKPGKIKPASLHEKEIMLIKKFSQFPQALIDAKNHLNPSLLANYSFELCQIFNEFYHACPVIGSENEGFRLALVEAFRIVTKNCLFLLGIDVLESM